MRVTEKICKVADEIIKILVNEKCTVGEAKEILREVSQEVENSAIVQVGVSYKKKYKKIVRGVREANLQEVE